MLDRLCPDWARKETPQSNALTVKRPEAFEVA